MERRTVARALRAIRRRKGWSQRQLGARLQISKSEMSRWERDALASCSVEEVERWATALGAHLLVDLRVDGARPLTDERHARIQEWLVNLLRAAGWVVAPEVSFNHFGERGRIDVLAFHPVSGVLLVVEIKTRLEDVQDVIGRLDVKRRISPGVAKQNGWTVEAVVPALFVQEGTTQRRRVADHPAIFGSFELRAREAIGWLRRPVAPAPAGILAFVNPAR